MSQSPSYLAWVFSTPTMHQHREAVEFIMEFLDLPDIKSFLNTCIPEDERAEYADAINRRKESVLKALESLGKEPPTTGEPCEPWLRRIIDLISQWTLSGLTSVEMRVRPQAWLPVYTALYRMNSDPRPSRRRFVRSDLKVELVMEGLQNFLKQRSSMPPPHLTASEGPERRKAFIEETWQRYQQFLELLATVLRDQSTHDYTPYQSWAEAVHGIGHRVLREHLPPEDRPLFPQGHHLYPILNIEP